MYMGEELYDIKYFITSRIFHGKEMRDVSI